MSFWIYVIIGVVISFFSALAASIIIIRTMKKGFWPPPVYGGRESSKENNKEIPDPYLENIKTYYEFKYLDKLFMSFKKLMFFADVLKEKPTPTSLAQFTKQLRIVKLKIDKYSIFIDPHLFQRLRMCINPIIDFSIGKELLLNFDDKIFYEVEVIEKDIHSNRLFFEALDRAFIEIKNGMSELLRQQ